MNFGTLTRLATKLASIQDGNFVGGALNFAAENGLTGSNLTGQFLPFGIPKGMVLMQLGKYQFSIGTLAHQSISRTSGYKWAKQDRIQNIGALQFTGIENEEIAISGAIVPQWVNVEQHLNQLRYMAETGEPHLLIDGQGTNLGYWVITKIDSKAQSLNHKGIGKEGDFSLSLQFYGDTLDV